MIKQYCIKHVIDCEVREPYVLLDINFTSEDGFGWVEAEGMLSDLLPLYDEINEKLPIFATHSRCSEYPNK